MSGGICIRCGSRAHTTREHDEGKHLAPGEKGAAPAAIKKKDGPKKNDTGPTTGVKKLFVHHDRCWARPNANAGIPDVIEPPFRLQVYEDPCIASWQSRDQCLCKLCEKKAKKVAFVNSQKKKRIAERGKN